MKQNKYGIIKKRRTIKPIEIDLNGEQGKKLVTDTAREIIKKHADVLKRLSEK